MVSLIGTTGCLSLAHPIQKTHSATPSTIRPSKRSHPPVKPTVSKPNRSMTASNFKVIDFGYTPLHEGYYPQPQALIFQDQQAWTAFWQTSRRLDANLQKPAAPAVDFSQQTIIGITPGSRNTGGYGIKVENVELKKGNGGDRWVIHYTEATPGNCAVTQATTTPAVFIAITKSNLPVELQRRQMTTTCQ